MSEAEPETLSIEISRTPEGTLLVTLKGEMDIVSSGEFGRRMTELEANGSTHLIVDLGGLTFIDSSGINALVQAVRSIEARGGTGVLAAPSPSARRVFEIAQIAQVVRVVENREDALSEIDAR